LRGIRDGGDREAFFVVGEADERRQPDRAPASEAGKIGIDERVPPVLVSADGAFTEGGYPWAPPLNGGFTVLELPSRGEAVAWAARIAKACRCEQELRVFQFDPQS